MESPIMTYLRQLHEQITEIRDGVLYPVDLPGTTTEPDDFGIALATVDGHIYHVGATDKEFTMQSLSKPFSYGLVLSDLGMDEVDEWVDVEPSGERFSEISLRRDSGRPANAMINAGALTVSSMIKGSGGRSAMRRIVMAYSDFAGRRLRANGNAYRAELRRSDRNHGLAYLLSSVGALNNHATSALETYLRQCTVQVTCKDLAIMAATLANGGTNPLTGVEALGIEYVERVLSVMMSSGMYDDAGEWIADVGMPAKSGVSGGAIAVLPGQAGLAVISPRLNSHGNSVRGVETCRRISRDMQMHFVRSARAGRSAIRAAYTIDQHPSNIRRTGEAVAVLTDHSHRAVAIEVVGDLFFAGTESVVREISDLPDTVKFVVLDVRRVDESGPLARQMVAALAERFVSQRRELLLVDPDGVLGQIEFAADFDMLDRAIAYCENRLLHRYGTPEALPSSVSVADAPSLAVLDPEDAAAIAELMEPRSVPDGEVIRRIGQRFGGVFFILAGTISTIATDNEGNRFRLSTLGAGMTFGDLALGSDDRQETTAKAEGPVELMVLSAERIEELEDRDPRLAIQLWRALARDAYLKVDHYTRAEAARIRD